MPMESQILFKIKISPENYEIRMIWTAQRSVYKLADEGIQTSSADSNLLRQVKLVSSISIHTRPPCSVQTLDIQPKTVQTLDSTNPRQYKPQTVQTLDRYKPQTGTNPRQVQTLDSTNHRQFKPVVRIQIRWIHGNFAGLDPEFFHGSGSGSKTLKWWFISLNFFRTTTTFYVSKQRFPKHNNVINFYHHYADIA